MKKRKLTKLISEGQYVAKVEVELINTKDSWSPYLSVTDAYKLDDVRAALRAGNLIQATLLAPVFTLHPIHA